MFTSSLDTINTVVYLTSPVNHNRPEYHSHTMAIGGVLTGLALLAVLLAITGDVASGQEAAEEQPESVEEMAETTIVPTFEARTRIVSGMWVRCKKGFKFVNGRCREQHNGK